MTGPKLLSPPENAGQKVGVFGVHLGREPPLAPAGLNIDDAGLAYKRVMVLSMNPGYATQEPA